MTLQYRFTLVLRICCLSELEKNKIYVILTKLVPTIQAYYFVFVQFFKVERIKFRAYDSLAET